MMKAIPLILLLAPVQGFSESQAEEQCSKVKFAQIVRVDDRSKRVFVQIKPDRSRAGIGLRWRIGRRRLWPVVNTGVATVGVRTPIVGERRVAGWAALVFSHRPPPALVGMPPGSLRGAADYEISATVRAERDRLSQSRDWRANTGDTGAAAGRRIARRARRKPLTDSARPDKSG